MDDVLQQGIAAFKAGDRDTARRLFIMASKQDSESERAWSWLYNVSKNDAERLACLKQITRINPGNTNARQLLFNLTESASSQNINPPVQNSDSVKKENALTRKSDYKKPNYLLIFLIVCVICVFALFRILEIASAPDATQCVKLEGDFCMTIHRFGNTSIIGGIVNSCDKPIKNITLHGEVISYLDNSIITTIDAKQDVTINPGTEYSFELMKANSYYGEHLGCSVSAKGAYFVK